MRLALDLDHFCGRVLQDALTAATAAYWERRAQQFEAAAPRPDDFNGQATPEQLADAVHRCRQIAANCQHHAQLLLNSRPEPISADVIAVLEEVAA